MTIEYLIIVLFTLVLLGVLVFFYSESEKLKKQHLQNKTGIIKQLAICSEQIVKRNNGLNRYDFLKYNLSEALIIQSELNIL